MGIGIGVGVEKEFKTKGTRHGSCSIVYCHLKDTSKCCSNTRNC
jgi:hypothetical protein